MPRSPADRPSRAVVSAFGGDYSRLHSLPGGSGHAWAAGDVVLKPLDMQVDELAWQQTVLGAVRPDELRVAPPRASTDGALTQGGWTAWERLTGRHEPGRWEEIIAAGDRFHRALRSVPRPEFLGSRTSPWAIADRVAWEEIPAEPYLDVPGVRRLAGLRRPVASPDQVIHGDLTGNVLFGLGLPPGVIDFSPQWRPSIHATAIVVGDAILFEGAPAALAEAHRSQADFPQALVRALLFRLISDAIIHAYPREQPAWQARTAAVELATRLVQGA